MVKHGVKFDYDLLANEEIKNNPICEICGNPLRCRWTDLSGQGVCLTCGCAYQLKWGTEEQEKEGKYPYLGIKNKFIPILKQYWEEERKFVFTGTSISEDTGLREFYEWLEIKHPEMKEDE